MRRAAWANFLDAPVEDSTFAAAVALQRTGHLGGLKSSLTGATGDASHHLQRQRDTYSRHRVAEASAVEGILNGAGDENRTRVLSLGADALPGP